MISNFSFRYLKIPCKVPSFIRPLSFFSSCVEEPQSLSTPKFHTSGRNSSELQDHLAMASFIGYLSGYLDFWHVQYYLLLCECLFCFFPKARLCLKFIMGGNQPFQCEWESLCANGTCCYLHLTTALPGNKQDRCCARRQGAGDKRWQRGRTVTHLVETYGAHRGAEQVQE